MFDYIKRQYRRLFSEDKEFYGDIKELLGIVPDNIELYKLAMIHRSASVILPDGTQANNERLEFLGDAVLEAIASDFLFIEYPEHTEGYLSQMRSRIVNRASLDNISSLMGIDNHIIANMTNSSAYKHLKGNALEAIIGAIYLDKGYDFTNRFVINDIFRQHVDLNDITQTDTDYKSRLIEWCQKSKRSINFSTGAEASSSTHSPKFRSKIIIDGIELGHGDGTSKKEAEQKASWAVTQILGNDEIGDFFMDTIDDTLERYNAQDGKVN